MDPSHGIFRDGATQPEVCSTFRREIHISLLLGTLAREPTWNVNSLWGDIYFPSLFINTGSPVLPQPGLDEPGIYPHWRTHSRFTRQEEGELFAIKIRQVPFAYGFEHTCSTMFMFLLINRLASTPTRANLKSRGGESGEKKNPFVFPRGKQGCSELGDSLRAPELSQ